jgi:hypothetical protein
MSEKKDRRSRVLLRYAALGGLLAALPMGQAVRADSTVVPAAQDATLIEDPQGAFASGSGPAIFAGRIASTLQSLRRALVRFDVAAAVPAGSTIVEARLRLNVSMANSDPVTVRLHRVTQPWGEGASSSLGGGGAGSQAGDATWIHRFYDGVPWTTPGGDFEPLAHGEAIVGQPGVSTWGSGPDMVADVQSWLDDPASNFGWILIGDETRPQTARRFDSRENPEPLLRPALEVLYAPPCRPDPAGPGFWKQACAQNAGDPVADCAAATFAALALPEIEACTAVLAPPPPSCDGRAARKLAVLILNVCANRLQTSCPVNPDSACAADSVGDLLEEIAALIASGDCRRAAACGGLRD